MGENAELLSYPDDYSIRIKLCSWLNTHHIPYDDEMSNEELRQLYIDVECGKYIK